MLFEVLGILGIREIGKAVNTQIGKNNSNEWGMYKDGNGHYRLRKNGRKVIETYDNNGDKIIKYINDGTTAVNISKNEAENREKEAVRNGNRFYLRQHENNSYKKLGPVDIYGERFCEVGKPYTYYVIRTVVYRNDNNERYQMDFYMNMKKELCFPTEEQIKKDIQFANQSHDNAHGLIILKDYTPLYKKCINEWNAIKNSIGGFNRFVYLGVHNPRDYKSTKDQIKRW